MRARTIGLAALLLLVLATFVMAQPGGSDATLVVSTGQATVNRSSSALFASSAETAVSSGDAITVRAGDTIQLAESASAQLRLKDGSTIDLFGGTTLNISELVSNDISYRARFSLLAGKTLSQVVHLLRPGDRFEITTPSSTAAVRGTRFTVEVISADATYYAVEEGVVQVTMGEQAVDVAAGYEVTAVLGQQLQVLPGNTTDTPPTNTPTPEVNTAVPHTTNSQPENITPESEDLPLGAGDSDEEEDAANTPTTVSTPATAPITPGNTAVATPADTPTPTTTVVPTNTVAAPTSPPAQEPTNTPVLAPTSTPAPAPTDTSAPPPTDTPAAEEKVVICHNGATIEVDASAVDAHLAHGDTLGPCP